MQDSMRQTLQELHEKGTRSFWQSLAYITVFFTLVLIAAITWRAGYWPVAVLCWPLIAHLGHMNLIAFHEASHYNLHPNRLLNETYGVFVGNVILTPLSVYRHVHNQHHKHLGTARDAELWPFVCPQSPRWQRLLAVVGELVVGFFYTPLVFLHGVLVAERLPASQWRRIRLEYLFCVVWWVFVLTVIAMNGWFTEFCVGYLIPSIISGNMQSLRKFTEHMGLLGDSILTTTRSVVDQTFVGRTLSESMMHIDYHGAHHCYARIPHYALPDATPLVYGKEPESIPLFPTYVSAVWDMLKSLSNPRVGKQWLEAESEPVVQAPRSLALPRPDA